MYRVWRGITASPYNMKRACICEAVYSKRPKKLTCQKRSKTIGKTSISAPAKNNSPPENLRLGRKPCKTNGKPHFSTTGTRDGTWSPGVRQGATLCVPWENVGKTSISWSPPLPDHRGARGDLGGCCKNLRLAGKPYKNQWKSMISHAGKLGCLLDVTCYIRLHTPRQNLDILRSGGKPCKTYGNPWFPGKPWGSMQHSCVGHSAGQKNSHHRICCIQVQ